MNWQLLVLAMAAPLVFAGLVAWRPARDARMIAMTGMLASGVVVLYAMFQFDWTAPGFQGVGAVTWIETLGLRLGVGVDAVAMLLIGLTALLGPICVLGSWTAVTEHHRTFFAWLLVLQTAMIGVFAARDLVLFYICFEFTLIPMYVLINMFGSSNRKAAATKFFLFTFTGSIIALAGLVYVVWHQAQHGSWTFDIGVLAAHAGTMRPSEQALVLLALMAGFAVKVPLFPVHTWLPLAHTEAPTAGSVILAGVLLKLGTYAIFRFVLPFAPVAVVEYAPLIGVLSIVGIIYAGLICWVQTDVKKLVAYSSVSHLGFCVLGLFALNGTGVSGSVLYMINHGLSTGALFLLIGMMYERYHTRSMREVGGLASKMPIWASAMVFFTMASVGLPGLNGFVSEFMCLLGTFQAGDWHGETGATDLATFGPWYAAFAGTGMIVAAMYLLYMVGIVVFGAYREPEGHHAHPVLPTDLNAREIGTLVPLAIGCLVLGIYPTPVLDAIEAPVADTIQMVRDAQPDGVVTEGMAQREEAH
ncbi:MAG: NADH-quinone oxidoreductase subunit M [Phycisphaerales bacterium]|nr:NADH-quinone oxidoreductase subunit M [Phycisphaerales bacterium]